MLWLWYIQNNLTIFVIKLCRTHDNDLTTTTTYSVLKKRFFGLTIDYLFDSGV